MNSSVTPQFTEGPVNADFSGVLQVKIFRCFLKIFFLKAMSHDSHDLKITEAGLVLVQTPVASVKKCRIGRVGTVLSLP